MPAYNAIVNALELNPSLILDLVDEIPASLRKERPIAGKWSIHEHIVHLARVEVSIGQRLHHMLENPGQQIVPYHPEDDDPDGLINGDWEEALNTYQWHRADMVGTLSTLSRGAWEIAHVHPEFPVYSVRVLARHIALHDGLHGYRIEELRAAMRDQ